MRIPKWQTMVSASPGFQYRAQLRAQPGERRPVLGETYLRDPRAGQRDMNLEVAAAGRGKYLASAISKGVQDIGETLVKLEAEDQLSSTASSFELEIGSQLNVIMEQKISEPVVDWFNGKPQPGLLPAYKDSLTLFTTWINGRRDYLASKMSNRVARTAFLKGSANDVAQAITQAASINRKQQIRWMQGNLYRTAENLQSPDKLDLLYKSPLANTIVTAQQLKALIDGRKHRLAMDHYATRTFEANSLAEVHLLSEELETGRDPESGYVVKQLDGTEEMEYDQNEHWENLTPQDRLMFEGKLDTKAAAIKQVDDAKREQKFDVTVAELYKDPDNPNHNIDVWNTWLISGDIDEKHIPKLISHLKAAKQIQAVGTVQDYELANNILANIENPLYDIPYILSQGLEATQEAILIRAKMEHLQGAGVWWSQSNPDGTDGFVAWERLKDAFGYRPLFMEMVPGEERARIQKEYAIASNKLLDLVRGWQSEEGITGKQVLEKALEHATTIFNDQMGLNEKVGSVGVGEQLKPLPVGFTGNHMQFKVYEQWAANTRDDKGKTPTYDFVMKMQPGPLRDAYAKKLKEFGWPIKDEFIGEKLPDILDSDDPGVLAETIDVLINTIKRYLPFVGETAQ